MKPDSITISGPPSMIDSIRFIRTPTKKITNINYYTVLKEPLIKPVNSKKLILSADSVEIIIPVEKFTEETIKVPLDVNGISRNKIRLFPEHGSITYHVALKDFEKINNSMFKAEVDIDKNFRNKQKLKVNITQSPSNVKITQIEPENVEFLILKK
jgi:hypothetical protein